MEESISICDTCPQRSACADKRKQIHDLSKGLAGLNIKIIIASGKGGVGKSTVGTRPL